MAGRPDCAKYPVPGGRVVRSGPSVRRASARMRYDCARRNLSVIAMQSNPVRIEGPVTGAQNRILTPQAIRFLVKLNTMFESRRRGLLEARRARQERLDAGELPEFPPETAEIRSAPWKVDEIP